MKEKKYHFKSMDEHYLYILFDNVGWKHDTSLLNWSIYVLVFSYVISKVYWKDAKTVCNNNGLEFASLKTIEELEDVSENMTWMSIGELKRSK